jgi:hypothetical protein
MASTDSHHAEKDIVQPTPGWKARLLTQKMFLLSRWHLKEKLSWHNTEPVHKAKYAHTYLGCSAWVGIVYCDTAFNGANSKTILACVG